MEVDFSYYILKMLSWVGVVWDLRTPPRHILKAKPRWTRSSPKFATEVPALPPAAVPSV